jgi:hypothetical protein
MFICNDGKSTPDCVFRELLAGVKKHSLLRGSTSRSYLPERILYLIRADPVCRLQLVECGILSDPAEWKWYRGSSPSG